MGASDKWTISKNKEYWGQKEVSMEKISFQVVKEINIGINLYNDGQLDDILVTGEYAKQYKDNKEFPTILVANTMYLELNQREKSSTLQNKNIRKAIGYTIDRSNYAKNILDNGSISAAGIVAKDVAFDPSTKKDFANKMLVHFDTEKVQSYWNKAKKELDIKEQITLNILTNKEETTKKVVEYIQGQLEENLKGLKITITPIPVNVQAERVMKHDFIISLSGRQVDYPGPMSFLGNPESNSVLNFGGYNNTKYDEYLENTSDKRWKSLRRAEELLLEDVGTAPFLQVGNSKLLKSTMRNIETHSIGAKYDYKKIKRLE